MSNIILFRSADEQFADAIRKYLKAQTRESGVSEWETDPEFALLAVARVVLWELFYRRTDNGDDLLMSTVDGLVETIKRRRSNRRDRSGEV